MIVVADASPLNYLIQVSCDALLQALYGRVLVPAAVIEELRHPSAPSSVSSWLRHTPDWIEVRVVSARADVALEALDPGEREAIQLAEEQKADLLLIDERQGRREARKRGIATTGTLGVLLAGGNRGIIDAEEAFHRLITQTTFRAAPDVQESFTRQCREQQNRSD